jgi:ABC-type multidrug transport system ATPase subunit
MDLVLRKTGFVPQFDILWQELTAEEHINIFAKIKSIPIEQEDKFAYNRLKEVGLHKVATHKVKTFSGGMKRRLSVCISGLGNPSIIYMDEPTTGLDPVSRRQVWELI